MLIQNDASLQAFTQMEKSQTFKDGGIYSIIVKEKLPNNEVIVQIKGQELRVKVAGNFPDSGKAILQFTDMKQDPPVVKAVVHPSATEEPQLMKPQNPMMLNGAREAIQLLQNNNIPITKELINNIKSYMDKEFGSNEQKLETIAQMVQKKLDFTANQIKAVHEALHGKLMGPVLQDIVTELEPDYLVKTDIKQQESVKNAITLHIRPQEAQTKLNGESSILQQLGKLIKADPNLSNIIQMIKESEWSPAQSSPLMEAVAEAEAFQSAGRELAARQALATAFTKLENESPQQAQAIVPDAEATYRLNSDVLAMIPVQSRDVIVTTITKKLSQAALDFKAVKRDISHTLQMTENLLKQAPIQARPSLEAVIKQLDHAILKSDFMLYTNMETEKKLLQASSQLYDARKLLAKGEFAKASEVVHQVRGIVDKLIFQPSDVRVKHFVSKELLQLEQAPVAKQLAHITEEPLQALRQEPTARHALEYMRSIGLSYDSEAAHRLVAGESSNEASLKNLLLKLAQAEGNSQAGQKAEQALQNLTGQQLMSKSDSTGLQTMMFSLPIILKDQVENVKVFLKSNNNREKIDWENCSLYFLLETKKMGDVGIMLNAVDRNLSLILKNDSPEFKEKISPLAEIAKKRLGEIGYKIGSLQFSKLTVAEELEKKAEIVKQPRFTEKGYDFSV